MRIFKSVCKVAVALALVVGVNMALTFAFEPYGSKSQIMWTDYRQQENLDTVYVGTSLTERAFDPSVLDQEIGTNSYNMATPGQWIEESQIAMETAIADHPIQTVVYGLEFSSLQGDKVPNPGRAFFRYKNQGNPLAMASDAVRLLSDDRCYTTEDSINWMFPWISNHVKGLRHVIANMRMKLDGTSLYEAAEENEAGWHYFGRGYGNYSTAMDFNKGKQKVYTDAYTAEDFSQRKVDTLLEMADYCQERGIAFVVVMPPIPDFNIFDYGHEYFVQLEMIRELVEAHGGQFYDLNLAKPELYDTTEDSYYADFQHLNVDGGRAATHALGVLMKSQSAGQPTESLFYATEEEYRSAHDYVSLVTLRASYTDGEVSMDAHAYSGGDTPVEYQMLMYNPDTKEWEVIRDWSQDSTYTFALSSIDGDVSPDEKGKIKVCANARLVGSDNEYDRYRVVKVRVR